MTGSSTVGIIAARNKPEAKALEQEMRAWLAGRGAAVRDETTLRREGTGGVGLLAVLGGDGLMMRCARMFPSLPLLGINFGHLGFLTMVERNDWQQALELVLAGEYRAQHGLTLATELVRAGRTIEAGWVINDAVIRSGPQIVEVELYIDGQYVNIYPGDGMIVATPQGSTAYCMSAGGPILSRDVRGFAVLPINPHSPIRIPLVIGEESLIELVVANDKVSWLYLDGNTANAPQLQRGDTVRVRRGEHSFALVLLEGMSFYTAIRSRFNFLIRPDAVPSRRRAR
jgi:NAD+ kinase